MFPMELDQEQNISRKPKDEEISIRRIRINTESKPVVVSDTVTVYPDKEYKCVTANVLAILV